MSVVKRERGIYHYRFQIAGRKFSGSTDSTDKREAERIEADKKREAETEVRTATAGRHNPLTFGAALDRFWNEVGKHYTGSYRATVWGALEWFRQESQIGEHVALKDIGKGTIGEAVGRRRGEDVSDATVNRTVTELLRRIWIRARDQWDVPVQRIEWKHFMRPEPKERIRSLATHEETELMASIPEDYRPVITFMLKSGFRLRETVKLRQRDIDWQRGRIAVVGKGNKPSSIPLSAELRAILAPLRAPREFVFTYVADRTTSDRIKGQRYPITYEGLKTMWRRHGAPKVGLVDFRLHDLRHTAATRLGRHANIKVVQRFMRHEDAATTAKYLHAFDDDVLAAMEAESVKR
jgi:integrase